MYKILLCYVAVVHFICDGGQIFHENSKISYYPDEYSELFGYSIVLTKTGLIVGAPKALNSNKSIATGYVFNCSLHDMTVHNTTCNRMNIASDEKLIYTRITQRNFFRNDMWFGATMAVIPNGDFFICAPRWAEPFSTSVKEVIQLPNGACYLHGRLPRVFTPLNEENRQAFFTDGKRKEYGRRPEHIHFYSQGQTGMSVKVTNDTILIGAPGLLMWTGGIISYRFKPFFSKQPVLNPYYTRDLQPDDYFGYSVESGVFERNGKTLFIAGAPRAKMGYGQVLIFEPVHLENSPLNVKAKVKGPHMGSYFGASLCSVDIDSDGRSDLLVGAPNFVKRDGGLPYDQGAVYVYMTRETNSTAFALEASGYVRGSRESGARFGTSIADLGDLDGDGFKDVAIGAPWEDEGVGVVYIYKGQRNGLHSQYAQRISAEGARGFGMSISKGVDINNDNCNDLAIGAYHSTTAYLYRCVPTITIRPLVHTFNHDVRINIPHNETGFSIFFCISASVQKAWPNAKIKLKAKLTVDPDDNRAILIGESAFQVTAKPGSSYCDEQTIEVQPLGNFTKPILILFELEPDEFIKDETPIFIKDAARLADESTLKTSLLLQVVRDCGEDLICNPLLEINLTPLDTPYIPGTNSRLGIKLSLSNQEETAYEVEVNVTLPAHPLRIPSECSLENLDLICEIPGPILRYETIEWDIELEYLLEESNHEYLNVTATLRDPLLFENMTNVDAVILVKNQANFSIVGKHKQNETLAVSRKKFDAEDNITFVHYFEVFNFGPSDWNNLEAYILLPTELSISDPIKGCHIEMSPIRCIWSVPANFTLPVVIPLSFELSKYANLLEANSTYNFTSTIVLNWLDADESSALTTILILDAKPPIWPWIIAIFAGLLTLATVVLIMYKCGFFSRKRRDQLKLLQEQMCGTVAMQEQPGPSDDSSQEMLLDEMDEMEL